MTDRALVVQSWDAWMALATGIVESEIRGRHLPEVFPELGKRGLQSRLENVAAGKGVEVLSAAFHEYFIACPPLERSTHFDRMRQYVTISPIREGEEIIGVNIAIQDVTSRLEAERGLMRQLVNPDEAVRFHAAESLADHAVSPSLVAGAMGDDSWRVRKAAVAGMARTAIEAEAETIDTLVEAIRHHHRDTALLNSSLAALALTRSEVAVEAVAELLSDADADVRVYAALALGMLGDSAALPALHAALDDPDPNVRYHAVEALGRIGDGASAETLAGIAEGSDPFLAFAALEALTLIGERSVTPRLIPLLEQPAIAPAVAAALGALATEEAVVPLAKAMARPGAPVATIAVAVDSIQQRIDVELGERDLVPDLLVSAVGRADASVLVATVPRASDQELAAIARLIAWLDVPDVETVLASLLRNAAARPAAVDGLASRGARAVRAIASVVTSAADDELAHAAAVAFGRIGDPSAVPLLIDWLDGPQTVAVAAAMSLASIGDRRAFEPLIRHLGAEDMGVRNAAVSAVNSIGHSDTKSRVRDLLEDPSPLVRESAARIAGYFGYANCLNRLIDCTLDADVAVRRAAVENLATYEQGSARAAIRRAALSDADHTVRAAAVRALGQSEDRDVVGTLTAATLDWNPWVRYYAVRSIALRRLNRDEMIERLLRLAESDPAPPVRISAIRALGELGDPRALELIRQLARDHEADVASVAIEALGHFDSDDAVRDLVELVASSEERNAAAAMAALASLRDVRAVPALVARLGAQQPDRLRRIAIAALVRIGDRTAIEALVAACTGRDRRLVVDSLVGLDPQGIAHLARVRGNEEPRARSAVVEALGRMKHPQAVNALPAFLDDPVEAVRTAAAHALSRR